MSHNDPTGQFRSRTIGSDYDYTEQRIERLEERVREVEQQNWELEHELRWLKTCLFTAVVWGVATIVIFAIALSVP